MYFELVLRDCGKSIVKKIMQYLGLVDFVMSLQNILKSHKIEYLCSVGLCVKRMLQ